MLCIKKIQNLSKSHIKIMHTNIYIYKLKNIQNLSKSRFQRILCVLKIIQNFKQFSIPNYITHTQAICIQLLKKTKTLSISQIQITHTYLTYIHIYTKPYSKFKQIPFPMYTLSTKKIQNLNKSHIKTINTSIYPYMY